MDKHNSNFVNCLTVVVRIGVLTGLWTFLHTQTDSILIATLITLSVNALCHNQNEIE